MLTWLFWASVALVFFTFAGYPLWLALWSRVRPRPTLSVSGYAPSVAIVIVAHNEAARLEQKLQTCLAQSYRAGRVSIVIASDGSTDETCAIAERYADRGVRVLAFSQRRGKAACLNDAVASCTEDVIFFNDARQKLDPEALVHLVERLSDPTVGAVSGELMFVKDEASGFGEGVDAYWRYEKFIRRTESLLGSVVGATGAIYAIKRRYFQPIPPQTILDDVLIPMQVVMQGQRVLFDGRALAFDKPSQHVAQERARKVRTLAGNFQLLRLRPSLLLPGRNPVLFEFLSHKVARLLAPLGLAAALGCSALLAPGSAFFAAVCALQVAGYALAVWGGATAAGQRSKLARIAHAFVTLNWFVVLGFVQFVSNRQSHLWTTSQQLTGTR